MEPEISAEEVADLNRRASELYQAGNFAAAVATVLRLPSGDDYVGYPFHGLSWHFCEGLADTLKDNPKAAARLYELAYASAAKDASYATSGAEGLAGVEVMKRIKGKQLRASRKARKKQ